MAWVPSMWSTLAKGILVSITMFQKVKVSSRLTPGGKSRCLISRSSSHGDSQGSGKNSSQVELHVDGNS